MKTVKVFVARLCNLLVIPPTGNVSGWLGGTPRRTTCAHVVNENYIATNMPTRQGRITWPHVGPRTTLKSIACRQGHVTVCIGLHRVALCVWFASRSRTFPRSNVWRSTCHIGSDATRGDTVTHGESAIVAYTCSYVYL